MNAQAALDARALRIRARRDVSTALTGAYRSAFRGHGLTFEELREYSPDDDVRAIEWNATARMGRPITKRMREERDLVVALLVDVSDSLDFGYAGTTKRAAARRVAAALAFAAARAQDRLALGVFAGELLVEVAPAAGPHQLERVLRGLARHASSTATDPRTALQWASDTLPRHSVAIWISDFLFPDPGAALRQCAARHELVALRLRDRSDELPRGVAPVRVRGREGGDRGLWRAPESATDTPLPTRTLRALGVDVGELWTDQRLIGGLHRFFDRRAGARA